MMRRLVAFLFFTLCQKAVDALITLENFEFSFNSFAEVFYTVEDLVEQAMLRENEAGQGQATKPLTVWRETISLGEEEISKKSEI